MKFGIPKETGRHEHRVGLTPYGVSRIRGAGSEVIVEHDAGSDSRFADQAFIDTGATIAYRPEEIYGRSDLVCQVGKVTSDQAILMRAGSAVCGFMHVAVMPRETVAVLAERELTVLGWEIVEDEEGAHPVLRALSEIAGHMTMQWAADLLQYENGGRGIVLGNIPGIPPATVLILGAGAVGWTAARHALQTGAHVIVMDPDLSRLRRALEHGCAHAVTAVVSERNLRRFLPVADVLVGAVMGTPGREPYVVTEEMVKTMKPGSVILDLAIDHGGCVETSRPMTLDDPTFVVHGVIHCCVPNVTSNAPRTASRALALAAIPYLSGIAERGLEGALRSYRGLSRGIYLYRGVPVHPLAASALGAQPRRIEDLLPSQS